MTVIKNLRGMKCMLPQIIIFCLTKMEMLWMSRQPNKKLTCKTKGYYQNLLNN
jgi:hypothetical protein